MLLVSFIQLWVFAADFVNGKRQYLSIPKTLWIADLFSTKRKRCEWNRANRSEACAVHTQSVEWNEVNVLFHSNEKSLV